MQVGRCARVKESGSAIISEFKGLEPPHQRAYYRMSHDRTLDLIAPTMNDALYLPQPESAIARFLDHINAGHRLLLSSYHDLYQWSINNIDLFWDAVWDATHIQGHKGAHVVDNTALPPSNPPWFVSVERVPPFPLIPDPGSQPRVSIGLSICFNVAQLIS